MCIYVHHIEWHRAKIYNSYNTTYWYVQEKIQSDGANNEPTKSVAHIQLFTCM